MLRVGRRRTLRKERGRRKPPPLSHAQEGLARTKLLVLMDDDQVTTDLSRGIVVEAVCTEAIVVGNLLYCHFSTSGRYGLNVGVAVDVRVGVAVQGSEVAVGVAVEATPAAYRRMSSLPSPSTT